MNNTPERITLKKIWSDLLEQFNLERGLGYTVKQFLLHPRRGTEEYLYGNRSMYTKPISFLLLTTAVTTFLMVQFVINQNLQLQDSGDLIKPEDMEKIPRLIQPGIKLLLQFTKKYFNLFYLSNLPTIVIGSYLVFRNKCNYNLAEILVINIFIFSIQSILYLFNIPFLINEHLVAFSAIPIVLMVGHFIFAYQQIFQLTIWKALLYSLLIYLIAQILNLVLFGIIILIGTFYA